MGEFLYKIVGAEDWARAQRSGVVAWSDIDRRDGFMHLSTAMQVLETARLHFAGRSDLVALAIDAAQLSDPVRYEESKKRKDLFPHLYGELRASAVVRIRFLAAAEGDAFRFADGEIR